MAEKDQEMDEGSEANKENAGSNPLNWPGPRTVIVPRTENGFGFTLRHFIVYPPEAAVQAHKDEGEESGDPEGRKRKRTKLSALEPMDTIFVKQVKDGGPAQGAGLNTGDRIVSVNGESVTGKSYSQVIALIQASDTSLKLLVVPRDEDILQMAYQTSAYNQGPQPYRGNASEIPRPPPSWPQNRSRLMSSPLPSAGSEPLPNVQGALTPGKPPATPRMREEARAQEDNTARVEGRPRTSSDPSRMLWAEGKHTAMQSSTGSLGSLSSGGSLSLSIHKDQSKQGPLQFQSPHLRYIDDPNTPQELEPSNIPKQGHPPTPMRTSSKNITLSLTQAADNRYGSLDSISHSSDSSNSRHSQDSMGYRRSQDVSQSQHYPEHVPRSKENLLTNPVFPDRHRSSAEDVTYSARPRNARHHSSEDIWTQRHLGNSQQNLSKSVTTGRLPSASSSSSSHRPYGRSLTTSYLSSSRNSDKRNDANSQSGGGGDFQGANTPMVSQTFTSKTYIEPMSPVSQAYTPDESVGSSNSMGGGGPRRYQRSQTADLPVSAGRREHHSGHRWNWDAPGVGEIYNKPSPYRYHDQDIDRRSDPLQYSQNVGDSERVGPQERPMINLVTERVRRFQSADSIDGANGGAGVRLRQDWNKQAHKSGYESVAARAAQFEKRISNSLSDDEKPGTLEGRRDSGGYKGPPVTPDSKRLGAASVSIYFRHETPPPTTPTVTLSPSPAQHIGPLHIRQYSDSSCSDSQGSGSRGQFLDSEHDPRDRSPIGVRSEEQLPAVRERYVKPAKRQPSYLSAIGSPVSKSESSLPYILEPIPSVPENSSPGTSGEGLQTFTGRGLICAFNTSIAVMTSDALMPGSSGSTTSTSSTAGNAVVMRPHVQDDREAKLVRRTSYLMATGRERPNLSAEKQKQIQQQHDQAQAESCLAPPCPPENQQPPEEAKAEAAKQPSELDIPLVKVDDQSAGDLPTTPTKTVSIRKLKAFFGERTPRIVEATNDPTRAYDQPLGDIVKEGTLNCKLAVADGKRASDRSWKPMWAMLRGHALYLFKDKSTANTSPTLTDEQPVSIKNSMVDIAYDYTKKKHVFRLFTYNGSEYLCQAEDQPSMLSWIEAIQANNNPDSTEKGVVNQDLIIRKTSQYDASAPKSSPQNVSKVSKKVSSRSLRSKSPGSHSPSIKHKKQFSDKDHESPKGKDATKEGNKTWKGKVAKKFKRHGSSSSAPMEVSGTFGVPIEMCPPSNNNENVPFVVDLCTSVVEAKGLEITGIYRVPGNAGAVNALMEELNKGTDTLDLDNDKWLDVNVVSSLLKSFFRKLPEPLITDELYEPFINANRLENPEKRMLLLKKLLHDLPECNCETFKHMAQHLNKVSANGHLNKMDTRNLAIVFGPTLVRNSDESMVTMVKDMSDQCRIVESIIMHHDWFFSSWDVDSYVPVDEETADLLPVTGMNQELLSKAENLELGDRGREISAKDLVTSIISAANRKIKRDKKDKKGSDSMSVDSEPPLEPAYNERDIDREIELRRVKEPSGETTSAQDSSSPPGVFCTLSLQEQPKAASQDKLDGVYSAKMVYVNRKGSESSIATSSTNSEDNWSNLKTQVKKYPAYQPKELQSYCVENSKPQVLRRYSEEMLNERKLDDEVGHHPFNSSFSLTNRAQEHLRRLEHETQVLRQKEEERRREQEKHAMARQRIEQELQRTRQELEQEDSFEELLPRQGDYAGRMHEYGSKLSDFSNRMDSTSITSDYSTTSSTNAGYDHRTLPQTVNEHSDNSSDYCSNASPSSVRNDRIFVPPSDNASTGSFSPGTEPSNISPSYEGQENPQTPKGGKFFVMSTNSSSLPSKLTAPSSRDDLDLYCLHGYKTPSGDPFDTQLVAGRGTLSRRKDRKSSQSSGISEDDREHSLQRTGSVHRKGSLDSLRDFYDKSDIHSPVGSSDAEDGDDLLHSISATFDQKLKVLLDPRYKLDGKKKKSSVDQSFTETKGLPIPPERSSSMPPPLPERPFRDSSLQGSQKADPKVGIASRFERSDRVFVDSGDTVDGLAGTKSGGNTCVKTSGSGTCVPEVEPLGGSTAFYSDQTEPQWGPTKELKPPSSSGGDSKSHVSKSEKTDTNLSRQSEYARALRKSTEKLYGSRERLFGSRELLADLSPVELKTPLELVNKEAILNAKAKSASPPVRKKVPKPPKRRHTVGGTKDLEHFKALIALNQPSKSEQRTSAWERLQPGIGSSSPTASPGMPSMKHWLQQERLRNAGSSPALLAQPLSPVLLRHTRREARRGSREESPPNRDLPRKTSLGSISVSSDATSSSYSGHGHTFHFESSI